MNDRHIRTVYRIFTTRSLHKLYCVTVTDIDLEIVIYSHIVKNESILCILKHKIYFHWSITRTVKVSSPLRTIIQ
jgi:hypothetical protein